MQADKPTLKDLARALGVSTATVHRALHDKGGVGGETAREIKRVAEEMGYRTNYIASALKRRAFRFAVVFPEPARDDRYYYSNLWAGARRFFGETREFGAEVLERPYPHAPGGHGEALQRLFDECGGGLSGVVTVAVDHAESVRQLARFAAAGVPVTLVGADLCPDARLCCVKSYDEAAGTLAAQLLTAFHGRDFAGEIVLTGSPVGSLAMLDQYHNLCAFETYIRAQVPGVRLFSAYNSDARLSCEQIRLLLESRPGLYAIYSASARHSVRSGRLLASMGLAGKVKLVGNDLFPESGELLRQGAMTAIIDKKPERQSYEATRILFNHAVKHEPPPGPVVNLCPEVVLPAGVT